MKLRNKIFTLLVFSILITGLNCKSLAQSIHQDTQASIAVNISATELIPADVIIFNININAEAKSPQEVYREHKAREGVLASLLKDFKIEESDINFQPIQINKRNNYNNPSEKVVLTNQQVSVSFSDFSIYEKIQVTLIENGFDSFNGQFSSSKIEEGKVNALESAIQKAKERATFIAEKSGVKLGKIFTISYSDHQISRPQMATEDALMGRSKSSSMMDFTQTVSVTSNISINFEIFN
jgi:uncharacterized protein YggE